MPQTISQTENKHPLAVVLAALLFLPLTLTILRHLPVRTNLPRWLDHHYLGVSHLGGVTTPAPKVPTSWRSLISGQFQKRNASWFNEHFVGREGLIRLTNELWFRLFHVPANYRLDVVLGEHNVLFEKDYLEEYFIARNSKSALEPWVKDLARLQNFCRNRGMGFVVLMSPSKASIYPEDMPRAWRRWYDPRPRAHEVITELFHENGISFVDGTELLAREKLNGPAAPLFPKGGGHWNSRGAWIAANAIQARFAEQNKPARPIELLQSTISNQPMGVEADLLGLLNLTFPWKYPCERLTVKPSAIRPASFTLAAIGGSFTWQPLQILEQSGQFSDITCYFYYRTSKSRETPNGPKLVRKPAVPVDFNREIFAADCLLLEINEASAVGPDHHLSDFLKDALAHLPDPGRPKPRFQAD